MTAYALAEIPEKLGNTERTVYQITRNGWPEGATFWNRETAEAMLSGLQRIPEGYFLIYVQTPEGWGFRVSKGGWKSYPSADIDKVVRCAVEHQADEPARAARAAQIVAQADAQAEIKAKSDQAEREPRRTCQGCGVYIPEGQGMFASLGLSCDWCYDQLSD